MEQIREAESAQALDRLRLLRDEGKQRQVYILSNIPLKVTVDYGWRWKQYQKSVDVLRACSWVVPKKTNDFLALIPDISERTARDWLNDLKTTGTIIGNPPIFNVNVSGDPNATGDRATIESAIKYK